MPSYLCPQCGFTGTPLRYTRGNIVFEVLLWLVFVVPGLFYSLWRAESKACPKCGTEMRRTDGLMSDEEAA